MSLGDRIKKRRDQLGLTQLQLAEMIGVKEATVSRYESNEIKNPSQKKLQALITALKVDPNYLMNWDETLPNNILPMPSFRSVPLVGDIACGEPIMAEQNIEGYIPLPDYVHADFCLTCKGDSMINARINDGDIVFIRSQPMVEDGEIAAVRIGAEATLKRVKKYTKMIVLKPENPDYPDIELNGQDQDIQIIGKAVHFLSSVK